MATASPVAWPARWPQVTLQFHYLFLTMAGRERPRGVCVCHNLQQPFSTSPPFPGHKHNVEEIKAESGLYKSHKELYTVVCKICVVCGPLRMCGGGGVTLRTADLKEPPDLKKSLPSCPAEGMTIPHSLERKFLRSPSNDH